MAAQLIVSISGISDRTVDDVAAFCGHLDARGVPVSFLVAPRMKGGYRLDRDDDTVGWLAGQIRLANQSDQHTMLRLPW